MRRTTITNILLFSLSSPGGQYYRYIISHQPTDWLVERERVESRGPTATRHFSAYYLGLYILWSRHVWLAVTLFCYRIKSVLVDIILQDHAVRAEACIFTRELLHLIFWIHRDQYLRSFWHHRFSCVLPRKNRSKFFECGMWPNWGDELFLRTNNDMVEQKSNVARKKNSVIHHFCRWKGNCGVHHLWYHAITGGTNQLHCLS